MHGLACRYATFKNPKDCRHGQRIGSKHICPAVGPLFWRRGQRMRHRRMNGLEHLPVPKLPDREGSYPYIQHTHIHVYMSLVSVCGIPLHPTCKKCHGLTAKHCLHSVAHAVCCHQPVQPSRASESKRAHDLLYHLCLRSSDASMTFWVIHCRRLGLQGQRVLRRWSTSPRALTKKP